MIYLKKTKNIVERIIDGEKRIDGRDTVLWDLLIKVGILPGLAVRLYLLEVKHSISSCIYWNREGCQMIGSLEGRIDAPKFSL